MSNRHAAIIQISPQLIMEWLDFVDGKIWDAKFDGILKLIIEHPDLPEVREGESFIEIHPTYVTTTGGIKVERDYPPKRSKYA